jgi:putative toxin-antitoxin system antitoxin component (TIGR02293 family)
MNPYHDPGNSKELRYELLLKFLSRENVTGPIESPYDFIRLSAAGISAQSIVKFRDYFGISRECTADLLQVSEPTIYRWVKEDKKLDKRHSMQVLELADLFLYGAEVTGNKENFIQWLNISNMAIGGLAPMKLLELPGGMEKVRQLLGRIEYGVYS